MAGRESRDKQRDFAIASESIGLLRALGVRIALDDCGTGCSSPSHPHRLPADRIKIDRSFVQRACGPTGLSLPASIMTLCTTMVCDCVAEGVEEPELLAVLRDLGCRLCQGYPFAVLLSIGDALLRIGNEAFAQVARAVKTPGSPTPSGSH